MTQTYDESVAITVTCLWQSLGWGFQVNRCSAWVSCDGQGGGTPGTVAAYSSYGETRSLQAYSQTFWVARGPADRQVECATSFVMPDYEAGASRASVWLTVPAYRCDAPATPTNVDAKRMDDSSISVVWDNEATASAPWSSVELQAREKGGTWGAPTGGKQSVPGSAASYVWGYAKPNSSYEFRVRSANPTGVSMWVATGAVKTTPAAPTNLTATFSGASVALTWKNSTVADSAAVQRSTDGRSWADLATASGSAVGYTDAAPPAGNVWYRVSFSAGGVMGAWTQVGPVVTYTDAYYPTVTVTSAGTTAVRPLTVTWDASSPTTIKSQGVALVVAGEVVESLALGGSARSCHLLADGLPDGETGMVVVTVTNALDLSMTAVSYVLASYAAPATPSVSVLYDFAALSATVEVADGGGEVAAVLADVARVNPDGTEETLASGLALPMSVADPAPPLNADYAYRVTAYARSGKPFETSAYACIRTRCGAVTFSDGTVVATGLDWEDHEATEATGISLELADGGDPVFYPSGSVSKSVSASFSVKGDAVEALLRAKDADVGGTVWLRSPHGRVWYGHPRWEVERHSVWAGVSCDLDVTGVR